MSKIKFFSLVLLLFMLVTSCGNQKFLKSHSESADKPRKRIFDEQMLIKNKLNFEKQNYKIQEDSENLWYELESIIQQTPDNSIVKGFRQWVYHLNDTVSVSYKYNSISKQIETDTVFRKTNGLQQWLHSKVGNAPTILDSSKTIQTAESMQYFLNQKGYFNAKVSYDIAKKNHKAFVTYNIRTEMPLLVDTVILSSKDTAIQEIIEDIKGLTLLRPGTPVSLSVLNEEKERLAIAIRNRGYYDFNWNYVVIEADTVNAQKFEPKRKPLFGGTLEQGEPRAKLYVDVLPFSDTSITHPKYRIANVYITPNEYILKPHQKRVIKKDSFFIVERVLKNREKIVVLKTNDILQENDVVIKEKEFESGKRIRWVKRSVPKVKKVTLDERSELMEGDILVHVILRKILKNKDNTEYTLKEKRKYYFIRDKVISDAVTIKAGDLFNDLASQETVKNIDKLAVFRLPRIEYEVTPGQEGYLDCFVKMQPGKKQEWEANFEVNNNYASVSSIGIAANGSYRNKNIFKGGEIFEISVQGGIDFKVTNQDSISSASDNFFKKAVNLLDVNIETSLYFPRFIGLKPIQQFLKIDNARTRVSLGYRILQQSTDFVISSFYTKMGYEWNKGPQHAFMWNPALVSLNLEPYLDPEFATRLARNNRPLYESLRSSFLIPSMDFSYTFSSPEAKTKGGAWFFKSYFEVAGNLLYLLDLAVDPNSQFQFFGVDYSQYFRTDFDIRYSYKLNKRHSVISRLMLGVIIPYGNSEKTEVPFTKRFMLGGPSSMRAWNVRYLGPGDQPSVAGAEFQVGDLRMEFNSEYRFMFNSWIGGALFVDIGNIWLLNSTLQGGGVPNQNPKTGVFTSKFYEQLGIGAGVGIRVDVSFFIFRLDFALQFRDPQGYRLKDDGTIQYWNFDPFVFENRHKFIIAIGYPF